MSAVQVCVGHGHFLNIVTHQNGLSRIILEENCIVRNKKQNILYESWLTLYFLLISSYFTLTLAISSYLKDKPFSNAIKMIPKTSQKWLTVTIWLSCTVMDVFHGWLSWMTFMDDFIYWLLTNWLTDWLTNGRTLLDVKSLSRLKSRDKIWWIICLSSNQYYVYDWQSKMYNVQPETPNKIK